MTEHADTIQIRFPTIKMFLYEKSCVELYRTALAKLYDLPSTSFLRKLQTGHFESSLQIVVLGLRTNHPHKNDLKGRADDLGADQILADDFDLKQFLEFMARIESSLLHFYMDCRELEVIEVDVLHLIDELLIPNQKMYLDTIRSVLKLEATDSFNDIEVPKQKDFTSRSLQS